MDLQGYAPTSLFIEREGQGLLESVVDEERGVVWAPCPALGTFHLARGSDGASRAAKLTGKDAFSDAPIPL